MKRKKRERERGCDSRVLSIVKYCTVLLRSMRKHGPERLEWDKVFLSFPFSFNVLILQLRVMW